MVARTSARPALKSVESGFICRRIGREEPQGYVRAMSSGDHLLIGAVHVRLLPVYTAGQEVVYLTYDAHDLSQARARSTNESVGERRSHP